MSQETSWDPESYARNARFVSDLGDPVLDLLEAAGGEKILDLGCGDGALTGKIAALGCAVVGIDTSLAQLRAARKRRLSVLLMDGQNLCFKAQFDAVFTNAALHWMKAPEKVVRGVHSVLKPGGRFVGEFGGKGNVEKIRSALHSALRRRGVHPASIDPWYYPSPEEYANLLAEAGFTVAYIDLIPRPTKLPGDIKSWLEIFGQSFINAVKESDRPSFLNEVIEELQPQLRDPQGNWVADYVRLRFKALKLFF
jgi:SAM-dependent methyltransferase